MASEEFRKALQSIKQWMNSFRNKGYEFDVMTLRTTMTSSVFPVPEIARIKGVNAGGVAAEWVRGSWARPNCRLLYLHGGGYVAGGVESHRPFAAWISEASKCSILLLEYRLAPEHPFPAALDDALSAYRWMRENGPDGKGGTGRSFLAGDSAGGGLAIATMMALRDAGDALPDAAVTLSAWSDLELTGDSVKSRAPVDPILSPAMMQILASTYLGGSDPRTPYASPLYGDMAGLPPLLLQVGDSEILLDDSTRLAEKAKSAGVQVSLEVWPEMFHVWQGLAPLFPEGQQAIDRIGEFIQSFFSPIHES